MQRKAIGELAEWRKRARRKPLVIRGARQVGKTWLMRNFGEKYYKDIAYVSFDGNERLTRLFSGDTDVNRILSGLSIETGRRIVPRDTLIIFDEIQQCPGALASLKYFCENAPQYDIVAAGSLLGVAMHHKIPFPVGKVEFLDLYPLSFFEFLKALGEDALLALIEKRDIDLINTFRDKFADLLRRYFFVGGMPEAVLAFCETGDPAEARRIHRQILTGYEQDFSKHMPPAILSRARMAWNSIPTQLSRENKKFMYGLVRHGARAKEFEAALAWLADCGLVCRVSRVTKPGMPLRAYEDIDAFKLFMVDVGLLAALCEIDARVILEGARIFEEFKGALTEQYVLQQLRAAGDGMPVHYWTNENGSSEVDFIVQSGRSIIPIEAKAGINLQAKSLKIYREKFKPEKAVRTSLADFKIDGGLYNIPLFMIEALPGIV